MPLEIPTAGTRTSFQINDERYDLLEQIATEMEENNNVDVNSWSKIVDRALRHYLETIENFREIQGELTPEQARTVSTSEIRLQQQSYLVIPKNP